MKRKTILHIEVTNKEYSLQYAGSLDEKTATKDDFKHDERLMLMLISNKKIFDFFFRIVEPARRYYIREAKKKLNPENGTTSVLNQY